MEQLCVQNQRLRKTQSVFISKPNAGMDVHVCLGEQILQLPSRGRWSGQGVYDYNTNSYDLTGLAEGKYPYIIQYNNCRDTFDLYIHDVQLDSQQTLPFCFVDEEIDLKNFLLPTVLPGIFQEMELLWSIAIGFLIP